LIDGDSSELSVRRQCELLGLSRSSFYYEAATETEANLRLMRLIDEQYMEAPFFGSRRKNLGDTKIISVCRVSKANDGGAGGAKASQGKK
jgi:hypothetical protein